MRIFVYEFVTGGGWWNVDRGSPPAGSLRREGGAMLQALVSDFSSFAEVLTTQDARGPLPMKSAEVVLVESVEQDREQFLAGVDWSDWTLVVAPEFDGHMLNRCLAVEAAGGRLLGPGSDFVRIAADKESTAQRLVAAGVRVPRGQVLEEQAGRWRAADGLPPFPLVVKPRDGAGSIGVRRVANERELLAGLSAARKLRVEEFLPGMAASVAVLGGPHGPRILPAARQILSTDGRFEYRGGEVPLPSAWSARAAKLAEQVCRVLPPAIGYWGIDLVLGEANDGTEDAVIEVNPRVTTSYLGLRRLARGNLAAAILQLALGETSELSFDVEPVQFAANGGEEFVH